MRNLLFLMFVSFKIFAADATALVVAKKINASDIAWLNKLGIDKSTSDELILPTQELLARLRERYPDHHLTDAVPYLYLGVPLAFSNLLVLPLDIILLLPVPILTIPAVAMNHCLASATGIGSGAVLLAAHTATLGAGLYCMKKARNFLAAITGYSTHKNSEFYQALSVVKCEESGGSELPIDHSNAKYVFNKFVVLYLYKGLVSRYQKSQLGFVHVVAMIPGDIAVEISKYLGERQDVINASLVNKAWFSAIAKKESMYLSDEYQFLIKYMKKLSKLNLNQLVREVEDNPRLCMFETDMIVIKKMMPKCWQRF